MITEKLIIVYYLNMSSMPRQRGQEMLAELSANLYRSIEEAHHIVLPIKDGDGITRVECINPKLITQEEYESVEVFLKKAEDALSNFLEKTKPTLKKVEKTKPTFFEKLTGAFKNRKS